jgi:ABC-type transport system substrate-binding protein
MLLKKYKMRPIIGVLAGLMLVVALACAGDAATPTSAPAATTAPAAAAPTATTAAAAAEPTAVAAAAEPTATTAAGASEPTPTQAVAVAAAQPTATPVPEVDLETLPWAEALPKMPSYKPEWGTPQTGGTLKIGAPRTPSRFNTSGSNVTTMHAKPVHANVLRFDAWAGVGPDNIVTDLTTSWKFSDNGLQLIFTIREGVLFQDNPVVPAEFNGGAIAGDPFTCEDVRASFERYVRPPAWENRVTRGKSELGHINGTSCPDGDTGMTAVLELDVVKAATLSLIAGMRDTMLDKDFIAWYWEGDELRGGKGMDVSTPVAAGLQTGYGPWMPEDYIPDVITKWKANPTYFKKGAPLMDALHMHILKDHTTRFAALATGQIHYFGQGSYSMLPGQVAQAVRDFPEQITVHTGGLHNWALGVQLNTTRAPFDDHRVRKAVFLATDRQEWQAFKESGPYEGAALALGMAPRVFYSFTEDEMLAMPGLRDKMTAEGKADLKEANDILDTVYGKGNRPTFQCLSANTQNHADICLFMVDQMLKNLNIKVSTMFLDSTAVSDYSEVGNYDMYAGSGGGYTTSGDPDDELWGRFHREFVSRTGWAGETLDALGEDPDLGDYQDWVEEQIALQSMELDLNKRKEISQAIDIRTSTEGIQKVLVGWNIVFPASGAKAKGFVLNPFGFATNWNIWERMWVVD